MARIEITIPGERIVEEFTALVSQPVTPLGAPAVKVGLVEISQTQPTELIPGPMGPQGPRGSRWTTGAGDPTVPGGVIGDSYLDDVSGAVWQWDGAAWVNTGTNIQGSPDTGPQILAKLAPVDGVGSGLDADLLDGQHGAYYLDYDNLTDKPTTFPPTLPIDYSNISNKPATFPPTLPIPSSGVTGLDAKQASQDTAINGKVGPDAPSDGLTYGRKNATWATIVGGAVISDTPPAGPLTPGQLWWESDTGNTYLWYADADSSQWVQQNVIVGGDFATKAYVDSKVEWFSSSAGGVTAPGVYVKASDGTYVSQYGSNYQTHMGGALNLIPRVEDTVSTNLRVNFKSRDNTNRGYIDALLTGTTGMLSLASRNNAGATDCFLQMSPTGFDFNNYALYNCGALTGSSSITSGSHMFAGNGIFASQVDDVFLGAKSGSTAGYIYFRPRGYNSATYQCSINSTGSLSIANNCYATAYYVSDSTTSIGNNIASQGSIVSGTSLTVGNGNIYSGNNTMTLRTTGAGAITIEPNGSTTNRSYFNSDGAVTFSGTFSVNATAYVDANLYAAYGSGNIVSGHTSASSSGTVNCVVVGGTGVVNIRKTGTATQTHVSIVNNIQSAGGAEVGSIKSNGSATTFITSSDENLKTFTGPLDPQRAIDIIRADPVREFDWISTGEHAVGWGAQTSYAISPDLASPPTPYEPNEDDDPELAKIEKQPGEPGYMPWGMDKSNRTPYLWAALSAALDKIDQLEARLAALEAA